MQRVESNDHSHIEEKEEAKDLPVVNQIGSKGTPLFDPNDS